MYYMDITLYCKIVYLMNEYIVNYVKKHLRRIYNLFFINRFFFFNLIDESF